MQSETHLKARKMSAPAAALLLATVFLLGPSQQAVAHPISSITLPVATMSLTGTASVGLGPMSSPAAINPAVDTHLSTATLCDLDQVGGLDLTVSWSIVDALTSSSTKSMTATLKANWLTVPTDGGAPTTSTTSSAVTVPYNVPPGGSFVANGAVTLPAPALHDGLKMAWLSESIEFKPNVGGALSTVEEKHSILLLDCSPHLHLPPGDDPPPGIGLNCYNHVPQTTLYSTVAPMTTTNLAPGSGPSYSFMTANLGDGCILDALPLANGLCGAAENLTPNTGSTCTEAVQLLVGVLNNGVNELTPYGPIPGQAADDAKGAATGTGDPTPINAQGDLLLKTPTMDGKWTLSVVPDSMAGGFLFNGALPTGTYATIPIPLNDHGNVTQPTHYEGSNPAPNPAPYINEPPPTMRDLIVSGLACFGAGAAALVSAVAIGAATGGVGTLGTGVIVTWFFGTMGAGAACAVFTDDVSNAGRYAAQGHYLNTWGAVGPTTWSGHLFNLPGILDVTSVVQITYPVTLTTPYGNANPDGYDAQKAAYERMDYDARKAAYTAHTQFREQIGSATATITINAPIVGTVMTPVVGTVVFLGTTYLGPVYYLPAVQTLLIGCQATCTGNALVTISSPGDATLTPGSEVTMEFLGTPGAATINILDLAGVSGFTLDAELGGTSAGPASGVVL